MKKKLKVQNSSHMKKKIYISHLFLRIHAIVIRTLLTVENREKQHFIYPAIMLE
jgi:hypothetical protein